MKYAFKQYPLRLGLISLLLTPIVALSVSYPMLLTKWYLPEPFDDRLGTLLVDCFGGFQNQTEIPLAPLAQYLLIFLPPIILQGYILARQGTRWQWMMAQRYGSYGIWWRRQLVGVWLSATLYRLVQVLLILLFATWEHRLSLEPLGWHGLLWMLLIMIIHTVMWMYIQIALQVFLNDARVGFGIPLLIFILGLILDQLPKLSVSPTILPGLWGMARRSWIMDEHGFRPWVLGAELIAMEIIALLGWRHLKKHGLCSR